MPRQLMLSFGDHRQESKAQVLINNGATQKHPDQAIDAIANAVRPNAVEILQQSHDAQVVPRRESAPRDAIPTPPSHSRVAQSPSNGTGSRATIERQASGEKAKARDILAAIRILNRLETERRVATREERDVLRRFGGFGPVALMLFPDPVTKRFRDHSWQELGEELQGLLSPEDYDSAKRTTFNAFYTSPCVMQAIHQALDRLGVPENATVLEPGCGIGNFVGASHGNRRFIGVELDRTSGRIARALYPDHDIRIENFRDTQFSHESIDAVIGNVPFANVKLDHGGQKFSLHDYFLAKSLDALKPGGILAVVTSHFTLDKVNAAIREYLGERANFVGAIRLPAQAFQREGTSVITDIVFLRKRAADEPAAHVDVDWMQTGPLTIEETEVTINHYFLNHPEMVLGKWTRQKQLYGGDDGYSVRGEGDLAEQLLVAIERLPQCETVAQGDRSPVAQAEPVHARFQRPPPERHVTAGGFFVGADGVIYQATSAESASPVTHGRQILKSNAGTLGKRLAALIQLRDAAREVLRSQNAGWPGTERDAARHHLNWLYDGFVRTYGPINKTTFGKTRQGTSIRRMPNLVTFREDPDAMLVMSLEEYDEQTGRAGKAAIMRQDVVGRTPDVTTVQSAEEGLLVSLDRRGGVDLPYIAGLYGQSQQVIVEELGDLIYLDPATGAWETADVYLSGNVRQKLKVAEEAGPEFRRHAEALRAVQPPDLLPGDIEANLGAPWMPEGDIQAFASELLSARLESIRIGHLPQDALWSVDADYAARESVAAITEWGTRRMNAISLLEQALNMKSPTVYDTAYEGDRKIQVVNEAETLAARDKQKQIKEKFRGWVFADPDRAERLVRLYNDAYNNLRLRLFDGSHLEFPGMNQSVSLRQHQKDAVWRIMSSGNTLLAHAVGAGKTFVMAAAGMKLKAACLIQKPMFVVPNHMLEQFAREFLQLYPNARLLVAAKEDMQRDRRKHLTARIASGEWDGIITTHSSFERIGMSAAYQADFLRKEIREYEDLLLDVAASSDQHRNLIKSIEKQKVAREEKLKELLAEEKKDDGLVFDELGVDHLFIDEAHFFKNLETPTKMQRVAGIQTEGSQRAFDLLMKARYLDAIHAGRGLTFATGTPISNTMVEMYTLQRFLDPRSLAERGMAHFDAWAGTFGEVVESMEISPDGASLKSRSRFAKFNNLPELQQMFRSFADVQTTEMLDLPRPHLSGGKPQIVGRPMSDRQCELQQGLVERYDRIRSERVDPREDNALAITTDGRKLALDARMMIADADNHPKSKVNALVDSVVDTWRRTADRRGTQIVFCDLGVGETAWGYSVYGEMIEKLTASGIPRDQIASIGSAESDAKKQALFERVRQGTVRVLIGSTQKLGTGTNVQKRLVALHHLDAPWKPAEVEQREGRILRQGNDSDVVSIYRYVTEGSFDAFMWQALETKARFITQVMSGGATVRRADDIGGQELSYAEVKAIASGNPAVLTLAEADAELQRLIVLKKNHTDEQFLTRRKVRELPEMIEQLRTRIANLQTDQETLVAHADDPISINGRVVGGEDVPAMLRQRLQSLAEIVSEKTKVVMGTTRGLAFGVMLHPIGRREAFLEGALVRTEAIGSKQPGARAVLNAIERLTNSYGTAMQFAQQEFALAEGQLRDYEARLGTPFEHETYLADLAKVRDELRAALSGQTPAPDEEHRPAISDIAERIKHLMAATTIAAAPRRSAEESPNSTAEEPVTMRLRQRLDTVRTALVLAEPMSPPELTAELLSTNDATEPKQVESQRAEELSVLTSPSRTRSRVVNGTIPIRRESQRQLQLF